MSTIKEHIKTQLFHLSRKIDKLKDEELIYEIRNNLIKEQKKEYNYFNIINSNNIQAQEAEFFIKNILPIQKNEINIISSNGGIGKSSLSCYLLLKIKKYHKVSVFAYLSEDSLGLIKSRIDKISQLHNLSTSINILGRESRPKPFLQYNEDKSNFIPSDFFNMFKEAMEPYSVIVLDPLIAFLLTNENSNIEARALMNLFNEWAEKEKKTFIFLHHNNKENNIRGASDFVNAARIHYVLAKEGNNIICKLEKQNSLPFFKETKINLFSHNGKSSEKEKSLFVYDEKIETDTIFKEEENENIFENIGEDYEW